MTGKIKGSELTHQLDNVLNELRLSPTERQLYLLSLSTGPLSVSDLAKRLGVQRPYLYTVIKSLREKGLAPGQGPHYQKTFIVEPPSVILSLLRKRRTILDGLASEVVADMPKYLATYKQGGLKTQVLFYEGRDKFVELYNLILEEEAQETVYFGEVKHFFTLLEEKRVQEWIRRRIEKKVTIRTLMIDDPLAHTIPTDKALYRETKVMPSDLSKSFPSSFQVFGKSLIFWQPHTPAAVVLKDEYIADLHRGIFDLLWKLGREI
ncbi:hypothetical protein HYW94_00060 [Candidatus Uhrbacteria bacterium]|nr:hypothetical protein [Candidatus Uhrbacteria bacterium]